MSDSVVQTPFPTVPNVMECGIAAKFVGQKIREIPEPFTLIVIAAGILLTYEWLIFEWWIEVGMRLVGLLTTSDASRFYRARLDAIDP